MVLVVVVYLSVTIKVRKDTLNGLTLLVVHLLVDEEGVGRVADGVDLGVVAGGTIDTAHLSTEVGGILDLSQLSDLGLVVGGVEVEHPIPVLRLDRDIVH